MNNFGLGSIILENIQHTEYRNVNSNEKISLPKTYYFLLEHIGISNSLKRSSE